MLSSILYCQVHCAGSMVHYLDVCSQYVQPQADPCHELPQEALVPMPPLKKLRGTKPAAQDKWAGQKIPKLFYAWAEAQEALLIKSFVASATTGAKEEAARAAKVCIAKDCCLC
jgi:hypothetical protein